MDTSAVGLLSLIETVGIGNFVLGWLVFWGTRFVSQQAVPVGAFFVRIATVLDKVAENGIPVNVTIANNEPIRVVVVDDLRDASDSPQAS